MADHSRKMSPRLLPKLNSEVDFASLDNQAVDVFLDSFSSTDRANVTKHMTKQLKGLRALLDLCGQLALGAVPAARINSLIASVATIIHAEKIFVIEVDHQQGCLVVTHSPDNAYNGIKAPRGSGIEASVISENKGLVINDFDSSTLMNMDFYRELNVVAKSVVAVPIALGDTVVGVLMGFNKQTDDFHFSNFDMSCLTTIAAHLAAGLQSSILSKTRGGTSKPADQADSSPTSVVTQSKQHAEFDSTLTDIIDDTYRLLGADCVSVFADTGQQQLLCISSLDSQGALLPTSCGVVGECFRSKEPLNVSNVKADKRHRGVFDDHLLYETVSIICVPLLGLNDEVLGVIEGVKRKPGDAFTAEHEFALQRLGSRLSVTLSRLKAMTQQQKKPCVDVVRTLGEFSEEVASAMPRSLAQAMEVVQKFGWSIAQCDTVHCYSSTAGREQRSPTLERKYASSAAPQGNTNHKYQGTDVHPQLIEALCTGEPSEVLLSEANPGTEEKNAALLPGIVEKIALVVPLSPSSPQSRADVLIFFRKQITPPAVSFSMDNCSATACLQSLFLNEAAASTERKSFTALEKQGLISLASVFNNALQLYARAEGTVGGSAGGNGDHDRAAAVEGTEVLSQFDCPTVFSTLCAEDQTELSHLFDWNFNVLNIRDKEALHYAVMTLFDKECNFSELSISRDKVYSYILEVDGGYLLNPFHNFHHAVCVTHFDYMLLNASNAKSHLSPIMIFTSLLSALVHDVGHPGNTNMYEINMRTHLAVLYNDTSVLENHHCSTAFRLMNKKGLGIFDGMDFGDRAEIRKMMIACIIATDMHYHVSLIELISNRASQNEWHIDSFTERMNYGKILLHAADLSNPTRPFATSRAWAERVSEEFNAQGKNEKDNGIPVSTFLLSHDLKSFVKNELFFSGHIVFPMWKELVILYPSMGHITDQIGNNLESWKGLLK